MFTALVLLFPLLCIANPLWGTQWKISELKNTVPKYQLEIEYLTDPTPSWRDSTFAESAIVKTKYSTTKFYKVKKSFYQKVFNHLENGFIVLDLNVANGFNILLAHDSINLCFIGALANNCETIKFGNYFDNHVPFPNPMYSLTNFSDNYITTNFLIDSITSIGKPNIYSNEHTSIKRFNENKTIEVYINSNYLIYKNLNQFIDNKYYLSIFTITGKRIFTYKILHSGGTIKLPKISKGKYIIKIGRNEIVQFTKEIWL